ncbi:MAG: sugar ABC transporter permease [Clostridia bacterium]|nr:sugar ABC transporter permease [Clostridia bacterium]
MNEIKKKIKKPKINKGDLIFYCIFLAWPVLQFCVYYIGVNFNSILMSFKVATDFDNTTGAIIWDNFSFAQYKHVFTTWMDGNFVNMVSVSLRAFLITHCISVPLGLLFAYYIYKKLIGWGAFRVILFLPKIISGVVIALMFNWFLSEYVPVVLPSVGNLLAIDRDLQFPVLMFYNIWIGFGTTVLMYSNKMSSISEEIIESAHLDGATGLKEFWHIVLPLTYSTVSVFLITGVAQIFVNQFGAYEMFQGTASPNVKGVGYYFFVEVKGKFSHLAKAEDSAQIPMFSAIGVVLTMITIPVALTCRWAFEKFGPSEE